MTWDWHCWAILYLWGAGVLSLWSTAARRLRWEWTQVAFPLFPIVVLVVVLIEAPGALATWWRR